MIGENCSSACYTRDHLTFGECLRAKKLRIGQVDATQQKRGDRELDLYERAVREGHDPESTSTKDSLFALEYGEQTGEAYQPTAKEPEFVSGEAAREGVFV